LLVFYFLYRCVRDPRYWRRSSERLGGRPTSFPATVRGAIWLHAVSVGEIVSAIGLIQQLRRQSPGTPLYISVATVAGRGVAEQKVASLVDGIFYAPIDYAFAVRRVLRRIRPSVVIVLETEIWPTLYREVKRAGCALVIVNGRISDRALPRYRSWRFFFRSVLRWPDAIFVQSDQDRQRYLEIGAPAEKVTVLGNLKYDAALVRSEPPWLVTATIDQFKPTIVWVAASTMPGADSDDVDEDDVVLDAFQQLAEKHPGLLLILAPRKPERFNVVAAKLRETGIAHFCRCPNIIEPGVVLPCVLLLDSIGELASIFPLADIVFIAGSLARRGGHNLLEPAACGRAIIVGPHLENFAAIAAEFRQHSAALEIANAGQLAQSVDRLIEDAQLRDDLGRGAAELAARHRGATVKAAKEALRWRDAAVPGNVPGIGTPLLWTLAQIWTVGSIWKQARNGARAKHLDTTVVSIGGISMGGVGKTPMVAYLAETLSRAGMNPAILTRGYRRRSIAPSVLVEAGESVPVSVTGDEAQILVHSGNAHAGIGADRWSTGRMLERTYKPDIFLLDDGFQHGRLARDLDIVLIDALNPFAGGAVFPLGGLREPMSALRRADVFIIVRAVPERDYRGIINRLRELNPNAPIFRAAMEPRYWINHRLQQPGHPPEGPISAFCGLGNPMSFWETLKALRIDPAFAWEFEDHHHYRCHELQRLAAQARMHGSNVLLTTEKDAMNLPEHASTILTEASVDLYWLKVGLQLDDEEELMALIESRMRSR